MTTDEFQKIIWRDALTCVDFFASWCEPCREMEPAIEQFAIALKGRVDLYRIDIDDRTLIEIIHRYHINSVPTVIFFRRGEIKWRSSGRMSFQQLKVVVENIERNEKLGQL